MDENKKVGFFDLKRNLIGLLVVAALITISGWYFGFSWDDVGDVTESVATAAKPDLPVEVGYRESMVGKGYVAVIKNISAEPVAVEISLRDQGADNKKTEKETLSPKHSLEIGWMEGWELKSGDVIKISNPRYQTGVYFIE